MNLTNAVCSITVTQRRRFFWAAWWTEEPREAPFRKPDASAGGFATLEDALADAERRAARYLVLIEPYWARAWSRVMRGERAPRRPRDDDRPRATPRVTPVSAWEMLGLEQGASVAAIKSAFRARALLAHPDHGGDPDEFRDLYRAYERLIERASRAR